MKKIDNQQWNHLHRLNFSLGNWNKCQKHQSLQLYAVMTPNTTWDKHNHSMEPHYECLIRFLHRKWIRDLVLRKLSIVPHMYRTNFNKSYLGQLLESIGNFIWYLTQHNNKRTSTSWIEGRLGIKTRWGSNRKISHCIAVVSKPYISFSCVALYKIQGR